MKPITLFYLEKCPFCKKAFRFIEELQTEYPELKTVEIQTIEEKSLWTKILLVWPKGKTLSPLVRAFIDITKNRFETE